MNSNQLVVCADNEAHKGFYVVTYLYIYIYIHYPELKKITLASSFWESLLLNHRNWIGYSRIDISCFCAVQPNKKPRNLGCMWLTMLQNDAKPLKHSCFSHWENPLEWLHFQRVSHFQVSGWDFGDCWEDRLVRGRKFMAYVQPVTWLVPVPQEKGTWVIDGDCGDSHRGWC